MFQFTFSKEKLSRIKRNVYAYQNDSSIRFVKSRECVTRLEIKIQFEVFVEK